MGALRKIIYGTLIFGTGLYVGDQQQPLTAYQEDIRYNKISAENGTPTDYRNYSTKIEINERGRAQLYFGNIKTNEYRLVNTDGTVGTVGDRFDSWWEDTKQSLRNYFTKKNE